MSINDVRQQIAGYKFDIISGVQSGGEFIKYAVTAQPNLITILLDFRYVPVRALFMASASGLPHSIELFTHRL
jgi:hypothetical protein